jgi:carboxymethylenebutenolidase
MPDIRLPFDKDLMAYESIPKVTGNYPGVVVIHDALGMSTDLRNQCDWLATEGYHAVAPDLFEGKTFFSCIMRAVREFRKKEGLFFDKIEATRNYLLNAPGSNGKVGVIGFCFGGGFALILSVNFGFDSSSVNYGGTLSSEYEQLLKNACPIVASYGALDRGSKGVAEKLESILTKHEIPHDVREYPDTEHAFMNDHLDSEVPMFIKFIAYAFGGGAYHEASCQHARGRIIRFFDRHLK